MVRCAVYRPPADAPQPGGAGRPRPVHVHFHGGGFTGRFPAQDEHLASYIASDVGAFVVTVDYDVAPQVRFPVAEEQCYDVALWAFANATLNGWDEARLSVGGASAGGKLAINVCQLAHAGGAFRPCALVTQYAVADVTRSDRRSEKRNASVAPVLQWITNATYFADASRRVEVIASPLFDARLAEAVPDTLILTGEYDTLAPEMVALGERLCGGGVRVTARQFAKTDHGFTNSAPAAIAREAIGLIGSFLTECYSHDDDLKGVRSYAE